MVEEFYKIFKMDEVELKEYVIDELYDREYSPVVADGFVYAKGDIPILLVAHLDTVHKEVAENIFYDKEQDVLWSPEGLGGDDRCGVWTILEIMKKHKPYVLFTEDEEKGGLGAKKATEILKTPNVRFIIEIDRRGSEDCVFYQCDNKEFQKYIQGFGFKTAIGTYTDIVDLSDAWDIASVNLSSGYYKEHTLQEYVKIKETIATRDKIIKILEDKENKDTFKYEKKTYYFETKYNAKNKKTEQGRYKYEDWYDDAYDDYYKNLSDLGYLDENKKWHWYSDEERTNK